MVFAHLMNLASAHFARSKIKHDQQRSIMMKDFAVCRCLFFAVVTLALAAPATAQI
jgi:hypothetical protein